MRPFVILLGIVMGSTVSIAAALLLTAVVFLLLPEYSDRLSDETRPLGIACALAVLAASAAVSSFYAELKMLMWRYAAHAVLVAVLAILVWTYWPRT
jgi:hypothetical protein